MQISVSGKQVSVEASLRDQVSSRLVETVEKYFDRPIDGTVVFSRDAGLTRADISVHVGRSIQLQGHATSEGALGAFDSAIERIGKRLRRHKRRLRDHHHSRPEKELESLTVPEYILAGGDEETEAGLAEQAEGGEAPVIVAEMTAEIETLSVSEAVMRMDLADLPAVVFRNSTHGGLNVVYRRHDGNLGWIDPDGATKV